MTLEETSDIIPDLEHEMDNTEDELETAKM